MSTESSERRAAPGAVTWVLVALLEATEAGGARTELQRSDITATSIGIGRLPENALVLRDPSISRRHAEVRLEQGRPVLVDLGSASGTFVGGARLLPNQPVVLEPGVEVRIGPYLLAVEAVAASAPALSPTVASPPAGGAAPANAPSRQRGRPAASPAAAFPESDELPVVASRAMLPAVLPAELQSRYIEHLPSIYAESDFLGRLLLIFQAIWEPLEQRQDHIAMYFSPETCPARVLPWIANWLNVELDPHWPERRRRELVREAMQLYRWRGTSYGLTRMLEVCTGQPVQITEDPERPFVFRITMPAYTDVSREFVERLVRAHKPAHVGYILEAAR